MLLRHRPRELCWSRYNIQSSVSRQSQLVVEEVTNVLIKRWFPFIIPPKRWDTRENVIFSLTGSILLLLYPCPWPSRTSWWSFLVSIIFDRIHSIFTDANLTIYDQRPRVLYLSSVSPIKFWKLYVIQTRKKRDLIAKIACNINRDLILRRGGYFADVLIF